jgi:chemotaxis protein methyltransferase CheR
MSAPRTTPEAPPPAADLAPPRVTQEQFREVSELAYRTFGLDLRKGKEALVAARLSRRLADLGLGTIGEYLEVLRSDHGGKELASLIDALTTNFTSFRREPQHFDLLRDTILRERMARAVECRIWSAGCATGEEPYTILMTAAEAVGDQMLDRVPLMATDISNRALDIARAGVYASDRLRDIPESWQRRFLQRGTGQQSGYFRVRRELAARIRFARFNLMEPFSSLGQFDVIFCRNVMIYFDKPTQQRLVAKFAAHLAPGGWLLIGHSEGLMGVRNELEYVMPAVYRKPA